MRGDLIIRLKLNTTGDRYFRFPWKKLTKSLLSRDMGQIIRNEIY